MNNLLIIGNGFDLAHGLKTSYNHFIEYLINEHLLSKNFDDLFNLRGKIRNITDLRDENISTLLSGNDFRNNFVKFMTELVQKNNWCDIEYLYFTYLDPTNKISPFINKPKHLNDEFEIIKNHLATYLKTEEKEATAIRSYKELFRLIGSRETLILNFNYTKTLKNLYSYEINDCTTINIHGELANSTNPIIFGYAANDEESRKLIDKNENEYMRNIKKHLYKRTNNEELLTNYLDGTESINVTILGHSCGLSDKLILNQILNHKNIKSINIFYYEQYEHYFQTQVNIDRIMNRDEHFAKLINFNKSHRMPQHNDTDEQVQNFIQYIEPIIYERKKARTKHKLFQSNNVVR